MLPFMVAAVIALATAEPAPPDCNRQEVIVNEIAPYYPDPNVDVGKLRVLVKVSIEPSGTVSDAAIYTSSGYDSFDVAAMCGGKLPARELDFQYVANTIERRAIIFVSVADDTIYSIGFTMPADGPFDPVVPSEAEGFCG
jgi:hypothetical protein